MGADAADLLLARGSRIPVGGRERLQSGEDDARGEGCPERYTSAPLGRAEQSVPSGYGHWTDAAVNGDEFVRLSDPGAMQTTTLGPGFFVREG